MTSAPMSPTSPTVFSRQFGGGSPGADPALSPTNATANGGALLSRGTAQHYQFAPIGAFSNNATVSLSPPGSMSAPRPQAAAASSVVISSSPDDRAWPALLVPKPTRARQGAGPMAPLDDNHHAGTTPLFSLPEVNFGLAFLAEEPSAHRLLSVTVSPQAATPQEQDAAHPAFGVIGRGRAAGAGREMPRSDFPDGSGGTDRAFPIDRAAATALHYQLCAPRAWASLNGGAALTLADEAAASSTSGFSHHAPSAPAPPAPINAPRESPSSPLLGKKLSSRALAFQPASPAAAAASRLLSAEFAGVSSPVAKTVLGGVEPSTVLLGNVAYFSSPRHTLQVRLPARPPHPPTPASPGCFCACFPRSWPSAAQGA